MKKTHQTRDSPKVLPSSKPPNRKQVAPNRLASSIPACTGTHGTVKHSSDYSGAVVTDTYAARDSRAS